MLTLFISAFFFGVLFAAILIGVCLFFVRIPVGYGSYLRIFETDFRQNMTLIHLEASARDPRWGTHFHSGNNVVHFCGICIEAEAPDTLMTLFLGKSSRFDYRVTKGL